MKCVTHNHPLSHPPAINTGIIAPSVNLFSQKTFSNSIHPSHSSTALIPFIAHAMALHTRSHYRSPLGVPLPIALHHPLGSPLGWPLGCAIPPHCLPIVCGITGGGGIPSVWAGGGGWDAPIYRENKKIKDLTPDPLYLHLDSPLPI